ncbi:hypothetical protein CROQUDRAFT_252133 [Cronartium quercuum f. sp. fusiforme G11]|uniref:Uncharacterized protein n=1 Tax=Cronartium quercuum f. sp. fusiforme G11 TaxID=708437 RepID=A0A9P6T806_9BASI|nr:hypothetical protein CROQUDRAFT_252133 [Cronartium quercuum f. sp. fusiforme G11]
MSLCQLKPPALHPHKLLLPLQKVFLCASFQVSESLKACATMEANEEWKGSVKKQNKMVAEWLPDHNTPETPYPCSPTLVKISELPQELPSVILDDTQIFQSNLEPEAILETNTKLPP